MNFSNKKDLMLITGTIATNDNKDKVFYDKRFTNNKEIEIKKIDLELAKNLKYCKKLTDNFFKNILRKKKNYENETILTNQKYIKV